MSFLKPVASGNFGGLCPAAGNGEGASHRLFHNESLPLFLLAAYGKNEKANLTRAERNAMAKLVPVLISNYSKGRGTKS